MLPGDEVMRTKAVSPNELRVGDVYWALTFVDAALTVPSLQPRVFVGANLLEGDTGLYYFQDAESYFAEETDLRRSNGAMINVPEDSLSYTFSLEGAIERLRLCEIRRKFK